MDKSREEIAVQTAWWVPETRPNEYSLICVCTGLKHADWSSKPVCVCACVCAAVRNKLRLGYQQHGGQQVTQGKAAELDSHGICTYVLACFLSKIPEVRLERLYLDLSWIIDRRNPTHNKHPLFFHMNWARHKVLNHNLSFLSESV